MRQDESISNTDFILNMLNSCIGVGLLAKPYALCVAGWYSIISVSMALILLIYSCYMMAQVTLTSCRIDVNHNIKYQIVAVDTDTDHLDVTSDSDMEQSHDESHINNESVYYIIGTYSLGKHGQYYPIVSFLTTIALLSVNVIIIEYQLITGTLQYFGFNLNDNMIFISIFIALLPTVFIMKWKHITFVSVLSVLSIIVLIITFIVVWIAASNRFPGGYVSSERFQNTSFDHKNAAQFAIDRMTVLERILFAFFTLKSGINANSAIPQLVMSLKNKSHSNVLVVIFISYALVSIICVSFGAIGVVIYRSNVSVLILNNLFIWPSGIINTATTCQSLYDSHFVIVIVCDHCLFHAPSFGIYDCSFRCCGCGIWSWFVDAISVVHWDILLSNVDCFTHVLYAVVWICGFMLNICDLWRK
eukprot:404070_1